MNKKAEVNEILKELKVLKKRGNEAWDWYDDALNDSRDGNIDYVNYLKKNQYFRYLEGFEDFYIDNYDRLMDELYTLDHTLAKKMGYEGHLGEK